MRYNSHSHADICLNFNQMEFYLVSRSSFSPVQMFECVHQCERNALATLATNVSLGTQIGGCLGHFVCENPGYRTAFTWQWAYHRIDFFAQGNLLDGSSSSVSFENAFHFA